MNAIVADAAYPRALAAALDAVVRISSSGRDPDPGDDGDWAAVVSAVLSELGSIAGSVDPGVIALAVEDAMWRGWPRC